MNLIRAFPPAWRLPTRTVPRIFSTSSTIFSEPSPSLSETSSSSPPPPPPSIPITSIPTTPRPSTTTTQSPTSSQRYHIPKGIHIAPVTDPLLTYFSSLIMRSGKRHKATRQVSDTLSTIHFLTKSSPLPILRKAIELSSPEVKLVTLKQRNKNVPQPKPLTIRQRTDKAIRWIFKTIHARCDFKLEHLVCTV